MEITLRSRNRRTLKKVEQDFQWYDSANQLMLRGRGGEMRFRYVPSQKRMIPYVVDRETWSYENDFDQITNWIKNNRANFDISVVDSARKHFVIVQVPVSQFNDVTESLYREKIAFDYDENQLRQEMKEEQR